MWFTIISQTRSQEETSYEIVEQLDCADIFEAQKRFSKMFGEKEPKQGLWVKQTYYYLERKVLSPNVFKVDFTTPGYRANFYPDVAIINLEEILRLYLPEICFGRSDRGVNTFQHPEVKKNLSYEFGEFDGNWHRTSPDKGGFIGIYFGNRLCDSLWYDHVMPKLVKRFRRKIGRRKEENFLIFKRVKEIEKLSCLYR